MSLYILYTLVYRWTADNEYKEEEDDDGDKDHVENIRGNFPSHSSLFPALQRILIMSY